MIIVWCGDTVSEQKTASYGNVEKCRKEGREVENKECCDKRDQLTDEKDIVETVEGKIITTDMWGGQRVEYWQSNSVLVNQLVEWEGVGLLRRAPKIWMRAT